MLEKLDLSKKVTSEEYDENKDLLEAQLGQLQRRVKKLGISIIILFEGWDASGKGTLINHIILPLDPRGFKVYSIQEANEEENLRPYLWRFWTKTPAKGRISVFDRSWYRRVLDEKIDEDISPSRAERAYEEINSFEKQLIDDGTVIIKFFLHVSKKKQKKRLKKLEENPYTAWRVTKKDWDQHEQYDIYLEAIEKMLERTSTPYAPWTIIEAHHKKYAILKVFQTLNAVIEAKCSEIQKNISHLTEKDPMDMQVDKMDQSILDQIDLSKTIHDEDYKQELKKYQKRLRDLEYEMYIKRVPAIILYEGWDAAGKGGNIRRLTGKLDPRGYEVVPISAPNEVEKTHHYLWRFWNCIPKAGHITIFDRSWYGRVLVERIEGFATENEWKRAFREINDMEQLLVDEGMIVLKFWLHIDPEEQLMRFEKRQEDPNKQWKITEEDWRNRDKWGAYKIAVDEMLIRTSTTYAPWTIIESNSKKYARIKVLKTVIDAVEEVLSRE